MALSGHPTVMDISNSYEHVLLHHTDTSSCRSLLHVCMPVLPLHWCVAAQSLPSVLVRVSIRQNTSLPVQLLVGLGSPERAPLV